MFDHDDAPLHGADLDAAVLSVAARDVAAWDASRASDDELLGPFTVRPGETLTHTFDDPGRFVGACTVHPSGELAIVVR